MYWNAPGAIAVQMAAGTVTGGDGNDTLHSIEQIVGTAFSDTYDATGFSGTSTNTGSLGTSNTFQGMAGDDVIIGNGATQVGYQWALAGVTVDLAAGTGHGTDPGDVANVGNDTFTGVVSARGSAFGDFLYGAATSDSFQGRGGDDYIDGRGGFDTAQYGNPNAISGISVNLAAGIVTADIYDGTDTLRSIEGITGTNFADTYNAVGFSASSTNAGSNGTFNQFTGNA